MEDDLPKSIVVILVILAVAISVLGTFTMVHEIKSLNTAPAHESSNKGNAKVSLTVENPEAYMPKATGKVIFTVEEH